MSAKIYHLDPHWHTRLMMIGVLLSLTAIGMLALPVLLPYLWISYLSLLGCVPMLFFGVFIGAVNIVVKFTNNARLVTTSEGIEYHSLGYSISSSWNNIERIEKARFGLWIVEHLILHQPKVQASKWSAWFVKLRGVKGNKIPVTPFMEQWKRSELGQHLKQHLLLQGDEIQMDTNEQSAKEAREEKIAKIQETQGRIRKIMFIVVGIFLIVSCLWGFITSLLR